MSSEFDRMKRREDQEELRNSREDPSLSPQPALPSLDASTSKRLERIELALAEVADLLTARNSTALKGMPESDKELMASAARMMQSLQDANVRVSSRSDKLENALDRLSAEVRSKRHLSIDSGDVAKLVGQRVADDVRKAVAPSIEAVTVQADQTARAMSAAFGAQVTRAERIIGRYEKLQEQALGRWENLARLLLALLPLAVAVIVVGTTVGAFGSMVGVGPLLGWAWSSFHAASEWWHKALIAVGAIGGTAGFLVVVGWLGARISSHYRGWGAR